MKGKKQFGAMGAALAVLLVLTSFVMPVFAEADHSQDSGMTAGTEAPKGGDAQTPEGDDREGGADPGDGGDNSGGATVDDAAPALDVILGGTSLMQSADGSASFGLGDVLTVTITHNATVLPSAARGKVSFEGEQLEVYADDGSGELVGAYTIMERTESGNRKIYYALVPDLPEGNYILRVDTPRVTEQSNALAFSYTSDMTDLIFDSLEFVYNVVTYRVLDAVTETWPTESEVYYSHSIRDLETDERWELGRWWLNRQGYYLSNATFVYGSYSIDFFYQWMDPWFPEQYPPYTEPLDTTYCHYTFGPGERFTVDGAALAHGDGIEYIDYAMPHSTTRLYLTDTDGNPIAGAEFEVFDPEGNTFVSYDDYGRTILMGPTYTTDEHGVLEVYGPFCGDHWFKQLTTAEGYNVRESDITFNVSAERFKQTDADGSYLYWDDNLASGDWHHGWFTEVRVTNVRPGEGGDGGGGDEGGGGGGTNPPGGGGGGNPPPTDPNVETFIPEGPVPLAQPGLTLIMDDGVPLEALPDTGAVAGVLPGLLAAGIGSVAVHGLRRRQVG